MAARLSSSDTSSDTDTDSDDSDQLAVAEKVAIFIKGMSAIPFKTWVDCHLPSETRRDKGYSWIIVVNPHGSKIDGSIPRDIHGLQEGFKQHVLAKKPINYQFIKDLAIKHNVLSGKWLLFTDQGGKVDHLWSLIASSVIKDDIPCIDEAKVSAHDEDERGHVICIYNNDFTNSDEVLASERAIRNMGIKGRLMYKPDVYTNLGIYAKNPWKMKPIIMTSQYSLKTGSSVIESLV